MEHQKKSRSVGRALALSLLVALAAPPAGAIDFDPVDILNANAASDAGHDSEVQVATDGTGRWIAVWQSADDLGATIGTDYDILFSRSLDDGLTWSAPAALNTNAASDSGHDLAPSIATDRDEVWIVVWHSNEDLGSTLGTDNDILFASAGETGAVWTAPAALHANADTDSGDDTQATIVTEEATSAWIVAWQSTDDLGATIGSDSDILFARSTNQGAVWSGQVALNANAASDAGDDAFPALATDGAGDWVAAWHSDDTLGATVGGDFDLFFSASGDDGASWGAVAALNTNAVTDSGDDLRVRLASDLQSTWLAVWDSDDTFGATLGSDLDVVVARDTGGGWSAPSSLKAGATSDSALDADAHVVSDRAGNWVVVWRSADPLAGLGLGADEDILVARSSNAGVSWTASEAVHDNADADTGGDSAATLAHDGRGRWVAAWTTADTLGGTIGAELDLLFSTGRGPDADDDRLPDALELDLYGTDPADTDTDDDGFDDRTEVVADASPTDASSTPLTTLQFGGYEVLNSNAGTDNSEDTQPIVRGDGLGNWVAVWRSNDVGGSGVDSDIFFSRSTDDGVTWSPIAPLNTNATTDSGTDQNARLATDGTTWICTWNSSEDLSGQIGTDIDILYAVSTDAGETWSAPTWLNSNATTDTGADLAGALRHDGDGVWLFAWGSNENLGGTIGTDFDLFFVTSSDDGGSWSAPQFLNSNAETDGGSEVTVQLAMDATTWVAVWDTQDDLGETIGNDHDLIISRSTDGGASWSPVVALNPYASTDSAQDLVSDLETDGEGTWLVTWRTNYDLNGTLGTDIDQVFSRSVDGGASWSAPAAFDPTALQDDVTDQSSRLAADAAGSWAIVWTRGGLTPGGVFYNDMALVVSNDGGVSWSSPVAVNPYPGTLAGAGSGFNEIVSDGFGRWLVIGSTEYDPLELYGPFDNEIFLAVGTGPDQDNDEYEDALEENRYGANPLDGTITPQPRVSFDIIGALNTNAQTDASTDVDFDFRPRAFGDGHGNWLAVWVSSTDLGGAIGTDLDILIQRSEDGGATWTTPAALNSNAMGDSATEEPPVLATDGSGNWIAVWASDESLGSTIGTDGDILVSRSDDGGASWTAAVALNTNAATDSGDDDEPQLATDGAGVWVAVWRSTDSLSGTIGTDTDILYARSIDGGLSWSAPVPVNDHAATDPSPSGGSDNEPSLATDGAGNWVVGWSSQVDRDGAGTDSDPFYAVSTDDAVSFGATTWLVALALTDLSFEQEGGPKIAYAGDDEWVAAFSSNNELFGTFDIGSDDDILVSRGSFPFSGQWSVPAPLNDSAATDSGHDRWPHLTADASGHVVAVWNSDEPLGSLGSDEDILYAESGDRGATWSSTGPAASFLAALDSVDDGLYSWIATDGVGTWLATWSSNESFGLYGTDHDIFYARGTGPDDDGDGLFDGAEGTLYGTAQRDWDSDDDGVGDGAEVALGLDPTLADSDADGVCDGAGTGGGACSLGPDNCPLLSNGTQTNSDAFSAGDACQCGDVDDDGTLDDADLELVRKRVVGGSTPGAVWERCNVTGPSDGGATDCDLLDATAIDRGLRADPTAVGDVCDAYLSP